ncbi:hypothetical protein [Nonomuraea aridisoli]|uniref:hypothetical protein n=1 Tax=Nonomuraea aridisoli TaxID=2070368 RepID=UPI0011B93B32|nr:hypothetical protein [Nonomuraea aridisoli]
MAGPRLISSVLALATVTSMAACSATGSSPAGGEQRVSGVAGGGGAAPGTDAGPVALTPEAYRNELDGLHEKMAGAIRELSRARGLKALDQRVTKAEQTLNDAVDALDAVTPPEAVRAHHEAYVAGLRDFAGELGAAAGRVAARDLCTSSAVLTDLGEQLATLDEAGEELESAGDYPADIVSVKAADRQTRRLRNGAFVRSGTLDGRGSLEINNGGSRDAVVTVLRGRSKAFSVYVRKKTKFKVSGVRDGSYRIFFTHGVDWDGKTRVFTRDCSFERFERSVAYKTTYTASQIRWHDWRITLHAVTGGNARTSPVDPDDFPS